MELRTRDVELVVDPAQGGRIASLRVGGDELLVQPATVDDDPTLWGCYPMVPWAGRVRDGRFTFAGQEVELPPAAPPHALHGIGHLTAWEPVDDTSIRLDLGPPWPFGGSVVQRFDLHPDRLTLVMVVTAGDRPMPVVAGWHPCLRRRLDHGGDARLDIPAGAMWERDADGIPTGDLVDPSDGPWDDAFTELSGPPRITWPGAFELTLTSSCPTWVVYDEDPRLVCVEPQTDAPDAFNRRPAVLGAAASLALELTIVWNDL